MTEKQPLEVNTSFPTRILPKKFDTIMASIVAFGCTIYLTGFGWNVWNDLANFYMFALLIYCLTCIVRIWCQRATVDSDKLRYYIWGIIPVNLYWENVSQIGVVYIKNDGTYPTLLGEMFAIVLKPCKKYEEGSKILRQWHIRPKWRHPFLVKNIYCETELYREIIEECSRKKISFERTYRW